MRPGCAGFAHVRCLRLRDYVHAPASEPNDSRAAVSSVAAGKAIPAMPWQVRICMSGTITRRASMRRPVQRLSSATARPVISDVCATDCCMRCAVRGDSSCLPRCPVPHGGRLMTYLQAVARVCLIHRAQMASMLDGAAALCRLGGGGGSGGCGVRFAQHAGTGGNGMPGARCQTRSMFVDRLFLLHA